MNSSLADPSARGVLPPKKSPWRHVRYLLLLLRTEALFGGRVRRHFFLRRLIGRIALRLHLYVLPKIIFEIYWKLKRRLRPLNAPDHLMDRPLWLWATSGLSNKELLRSWTSPSCEQPKIIVLGTGSLGDVLQITPVLRALRAKIPNASIVLLHRSIIASRVLAGNTAVNSVATADFYTFSEIKRAVEIEGVADLVVEIESVTYLVTYTRSPKALRHASMNTLFPDAFFRQAEAGLDLWRNPPAQPLDKEHKSRWPEKWRGYHFLDVLGSTGNLPINRKSRLDFVITDCDVDTATKFGVPASFVTVQNGVDNDVMNWAQATGQHPTKLLPIATWSAVVKILKLAGLTVVQLGGVDDVLVTGVDVDLRGKTTLSEAGLLLRQAQCHMGTEGGLVHLAQAVGGRAVVVFGPTSVDFFGYPDNMNLIASDCTSCWRSTRDWYIYCPRGLPAPECMTAHRPNMIAQAVLSLIASGKTERDDVALP